MKEKIFSSLKQAYSSLGLGDEILQAHAEGLANLNLVTDENLEAVVNAQKTYLEGLQKLNDKRVTEAQKKAEEKARKQFEEETKKKEEEAAKKAEEEAKKKAEEDAKKKEEEEKAKKKAEEEEAERKRKEELEKENQIPEAVKKLLLERDELAKKEREKYENRIAQLLESSTKNQTAFEKYVEEQNKKSQDLLDRYDAMKKEADEAKAENAKRQRADFIINKAKELEIPSYRIDEGFAIKDDDDENTITEYLTRISNNIKAASLSQDKPHILDDNSKPSKEELQNIAKMLVK